MATSILALAFFVLLSFSTRYCGAAHSVMDSRVPAGLFLDTLRNYKAFWRVLGNSLGLAVFVGITSTLIGLAFALAATRSQSRLTVLLRSFSLLPMITPPFVVGLAIILLFGLQGFVTSTLLGLQTRGIFGFPGLALAQTLSFAPVAFLVIASVVEAVNPALEEASLTLRAGRWETFWKVTLPLLRPGLANAFLLTIIESLADFGNPIVLGASSRCSPPRSTSASSAASTRRWPPFWGLSFSLLPGRVPPAAICRQAFHVTVSGRCPPGGPCPAARLEIGLLGFCACWRLHAALYLFVVYGGFVEIWGINNRSRSSTTSNSCGTGWTHLYTTLILAGVSSP
jgi:iron(III) transport system permease protein